MIHNAPHTSSSIVSKSIAKGGGKVDYRRQSLSISHLKNLLVILNVIPSLWMIFQHLILFL